MKTEISFSLFNWLNHFSAKHRKTCSFKTKKEKFESSKQVSRFELIVSPFLI